MRDKTNSYIDFAQHIIYYVIYMYIDFDYWYVLNMFLYIVYE